RGGETRHLGAAVAGMHRSRVRHRRSSVLDRQVTATPAPRVHAETRSANVDFTGSRDARDRIWSRPPRASAIVARLSWHTSCVYITGEALGRADCGSTMMAGDHTEAKKKWRAAVASPIDVRSETP